MPRIQLKFIANLYNSDEKHPKIIKKNVCTNKSVDIRDIHCVEEMFNSRGNILKKRCKIFIREIGPTIVDESYEKIVQLLEKETEDKKFRSNIGFQYPGKK